MPSNVFFHPDFTVGTGITPVRQRRFTVVSVPPFADFTAGQEFHLAPKIICCYYFMLCQPLCQESYYAVQVRQAPGRFLGQSPKWGLGQRPKVFWLQSTWLYDEKERDTPMKIFTKQEIRALEDTGAQAGIPLSQMMEQAGRALASAIEDRLRPLKGRAIALLCGSGNNGGDGFVCARVLAEKGARCTVLLTQGEPQTDLARAAFIQMPETVTPLCAQHQRQESEEALSAAACVVDCIFGFGFHGTLSGDPAHFLALSNSLPCLRVAADLPSGTECDSAKASENTFQAHVTVAFSGKKPAHVSYPARAFCGDVLVAPVGIPPHLTEAAPASLLELDTASLLPFLPPKGAQANKRDFGRLLLVCGSFGMAGACIMAARGALRCGVGLLHIAIDARAYPIVASAVPEAIFTLLDFSSPTWQEELTPALEACTACAIGSGLGASADFLCPPVFSYFAHQSKPLLLDADALNYCARHPDTLNQLNAPLVTTPHPGEMARLLGLTAAQVQQERLPLAQRFAAQTGAVTVLKGAGTIIAGESQTALNPTGNWGMAKGGSGDVLAGIIGAFLAQEIPPFAAAALGVYLHGLAGDLCRERFTAPAMLPTDLPEMLPYAWKKMLPPCAKSAAGI